MAVDFVGDNRLIFDIGGNKYRLIVGVTYPFGRVLIKFVGTHKDYDRIDPRDRVGDRVMDIRPIKTPADYEWALAEVERYFDNEPQPGTPEGDRFEVLADLIETYESRYWPIEAANPIDILREFMKTRNFDQGDLGSSRDRGPAPPRFSTASDTCHSK